MTLEIRYKFYPYRLNLQRKQSVELCIDLTNKSDKPRLMSVELLLDNSLSFDKSGLKKGAIQHLGEILQGQGKKIFFDVYPKHARKGEAPIELRIFEHQDNYAYVVNKWERHLSLVIE